MLPAQRPRWWPGELQCRGPFAPFSLRKQLRNRGGERISASTHGEDALEVGADFNATGTGTDGVKIEVIKVRDITEKQASHPSR